MNYTKEVIKGIIARLKATTALTDIVSTRIYTDIPQNTDLDYCRLRVNSTPEGVMESSQYVYLVQVQVFVKQHLDALNAFDAVVNALDRQEANITLDTQTVASVAITGVQDIFKEEDQATQAPPIWQALAIFNLRLA